MNNNRHNPPYHLLMVTNTLARGGAEAMLVQLALALDRKIVRPVAICLKEAGAWANLLAERSIPVHSRLLSHKYDFRVLGRLSRLVSDNEPACLMAVGSGGDRMFWSTLAARRRKVPMIVWSHIFPSPGHLYFEWINRRLYGEVDTFVALGQEHRRALIELEKIPADRLQVIHNGINVGKFDCPQKRPEGRQLLGMDNDETVAVGIVANLRADKRHDIFVEAAAKTYAQRDCSRFAIVGDGPQRSAVEQLVAKYDPGGSFITMLGEHDDPAGLIQGLDIVCLTSEWHECLSITMLEAMAAGKVFVAPRIGSLDEALIDGETGRFFGPLTSEALADVLVELIDQPAQRRELGRGAYEKVHAEFTAERMARRFESLITDLCK
ncbi:MAG: glycosyltransferase [Planctomycetota bacterium]|jgi:glycosyltransferase involved in cell wall biosynthesis